MSVHLRKDGAWIVRFRENGRELTRYFGKGESAHADARAFNAQLGHREWVRRTPKQAGITFGEIARLYLEAAPARMEPSSIDNLVWKLNARILPLLTAEPAPTINPTKLDDYVARRLRQGYTRRDGGEVRYPKTVTIWREVTDILAILHWAFNRGYIHTYPAAGWRKPKRDDAVIAPPTREELRKLLKAAPEHLNKALCLSWYTGCRPGSELLSLRYNAIDWDSRTIFITSAKKNGPRSRAVALHPDLYRLLKGWRAAETTDHIITYRGAPIVSLKTSWKSCKRRAGITRRLRLYDCRHAFASNALKMGDMKGTSQILGHSRPDTTIRIYTHSNPEQERAIVHGIPSVTDESQFERKKKRKGLKIMK